MELINQASLYGKDSVRVQHLRHVQELILRKDPSLLDNFLEVYFIRKRKFFFLLI